MRIFISYKRDSEPDVPVARQICNTLRGEGHEVFIDRDMAVGEQWAKRIDDEIRRSNFFVTLLSQNSIHSEMVHEEIKKASDVADENGGEPKILPVRLAYREQFTSPLSRWLNPLNWALWDSPADTLRVVGEILRVVNGSGKLPVGRESKEKELVTGETPDVPQPLPSTQTEPFPEESSHPEVRFYVTREADGVAREKIRESGATITIKAPRQMGKSSLLVRTAAEASRAGKRVAMLDFQFLDKVSLKNADVFFRQFCSWISYVLEIEDKVEEFWKIPIGNSFRCTRYVERHVLKELKGESLVLAMDEVDSVLNADFYIDFFSMLRGWHGARGDDQPTVWNRLDLALVISTEPYQLIDMPFQSPFNVGEVLELGDFTPEQVKDLNKRHAYPFNPEEVQMLVELLHGHPYLTRRALYLVASQRATPEELFGRATDDHGPFGDHLRHHLMRLYDKGNKSPEMLELQANLIKGLSEVFAKKTCTDMLTFYRLRGAGLVREQEEGKNGHKVSKIVPRCKLYEDYFREHINA